MRAQGIDIYSGYQPEYNYKIKKHGFVILKASDGSWTNPDLREASAKMPAPQLMQIAHVPLKGAYHYLRYNISVDRQVKSLLDAARVTDADILRGYAKPGQKWLFDFLAVDFEKKYNKPSMRFGHDTKEIMDQVRRETGLEVFFYSNKYIIQDWLYKYGNFWMRDDPEKYPLWIAQYPYYGWNDNLLDALQDRHDLRFSDPSLPAGMFSWSIWQYSADGNRKGVENGIKKPAHYVYSPAVDLLVFNGDLTAFYQKIGKPLPNKPQQPPSEDTEPEAVVDISKIRKEAFREAVNAINKIDP